MKTNIPKNKTRVAEIILPPNRLRKKVGFGGFDPAQLEKAKNVPQQQQALFEQSLIETMQEFASLIAKARQEPSGVQAESFYIHAMTLKSNGEQAGFPLMTEVGSKLVRLLDSLHMLDARSIILLQAFHNTMISILRKKIKEGTDPKARQLVAILDQACAMYHRDASGLIN